MGVERAETRSLQRLEAGRMRSVAAGAGQEAKAEWRGL